MQASEFDFPFDEQLIAHQPLARRDESRLMHLSRPGGSVGHHGFRELPALLREGDVLVLNDTRVIPARFFARRATGGRIEGLFLHEPAAGTWSVMLKGADRCGLGERLAVEGTDVRLELREKLQAGQWMLAVDPARPAVDILEQCGTTPLPPYIRRAPRSTGILPVSRMGVSPMQSQPVGETPAPRPDGHGRDARETHGQDARVTDAERYQTIYAAKPGAVAAPTAGLHFTPEIFDALSRRGIETAHVTLHVGAGTFLPVKADDISHHTMHAEWFDLPAATADRLRAARAARRRIVAVGTTAVRVLETAAATNADESDAATSDMFRPASGWTRIFIYPPYTFRAVDALITNFHLPRSTLFMLVSAFGAPGRTDGIAILRAAYAQAVAERYRFFSYGDAMLID